MAGRILAASVAICYSLSPCTIACANVEDVFDIVWILTAEKRVLCLRIKDQMREMHSLLGLKLSLITGPPIFALTDVLVAAAVIQHNQHRLKIRLKLCPLLRASLTFPTALKREGYIRVVGAEARIAGKIVTL